MTVTIMRPVHMDRAPLPDAGLPLPGSMLARAIAHAMTLRLDYIRQGITDPNARTLAASRACLKYGTGRADTLAGLVRAVDGSDGAWSTLDTGAV